VLTLYIPPGKPSDALTTMSVKSTGSSLVTGPTADGFCSGNAYFRWKVVGRTLTVKPVKDECDPRWILLTVGSWTRS